LVKFYITLLIIIALTICASSVSLWNDDAKSLYSSSRAHKIGDIITILIEETTRAAQSAGTNTSKQSAVNADLLASWSKVASALGSSSRDDTRSRGQISAGDDYSGEGKTSRQSTVKGRISATVAEVLPNGNLYVVGRHNVNVNEETETIVVAGIIRPEDISAQNSVLSAQIADAQISIKGSGVVAQKQSPGILTRLFGWMF